jgi:hypothetical protein
MKKKLIKIFEALFIFILMTPLQKRPDKTCPYYTLAKRQEV